MRCGVTRWQNKKCFKGIVGEWGKGGWRRWIQDGRLAHVLPISLLPINWHPGWPVLIRCPQVTCKDALPYTVKINTFRVRAKSTYITKQQLLNMTFIKHIYIEIVLARLSLKKQGSILPQTTWYFQNRGTE